LTGNRALIIVGEGLVPLMLLGLLTAVAAASGYAQWWADPRGWSILVNSFVFAAMAAMVGTVGGYAIGRAGIGWALVACAALLIPSSLCGSAWIVALGRHGPLGAWISIYQWPVAAAVTGLRYLGVAALIVAVHLRGRDAAGKVFHVRHAWWWLGVRPALRPVTAAWLGLLLLISAESILPSMFLIPTYGTEILIQYNALLDLPGAAALATPMLATTIGLVAVAGVIGRPYPSSNKACRVANSPHVAVMALAALAVGLGVPCAALAWQARSFAAVIDAMGQMRAEIGHTLILAGVGAVVCALSGWVMGECWLRAWRERKFSLVPLTMLNLIAPGSLLALGVIDLSQRWPLQWARDTDIGLLLAYVSRFVPLATLIVFAWGVSHPTLAAEAAKVLGVSRWRRLRHIVWPSRRRPLAMAAVVCALLIGTEVEMSVLLTTAGTTTVGVRLYTLIHTAPQAQVSAAALAVLLLFTPLLLSAGVIARTKAR
jgi:ABC-type Fe3+ transport system permease subunit